MSKPHITSLMVRPERRDKKSFFIHHCACEYENTRHAYIEESLLFKIFFKEITIVTVTT